VTNYEQVSKIKGVFDLVIMDEAHNVGAFPKPSKRTLEIRDIAYDLPLILLSGTPVVESPAKIFHQCFVTKYSPFASKNFYMFHKAYGIPYSKFINGRELKFYDRTIPELMEKINEFCVFMTQEDAGIDASLQAVDKVHYVALSDETKRLYNNLQYKRVIAIDGKDLVCDSIMKLRTSLHMIESGVCKIDDDYILIGNTEKIDYIKSTFGDSEDIGIMSHYVGERLLLEKHFKKAKIYSSSAHSEGVDLSHLKHFVIASSDYSGSKFIQRRERIININGSNTLIVNHILVKGAISEQVYNAVSKKMDFNNSCYEMNKI
jgi:hypothetical protein